MMCGPSSRMWPQRFAAWERSFGSGVRFVGYARDCSKSLSFKPLVRAFQHATLGQPGIGTIVLWHMLLAVEDV